MRPTTATLLAALALAPTTALAQRPPSTARVTGARVYVVRSGDTLLRVANRLGVPPRELAARNGIAPPYRLTVGRRLRLPDGVSPEVLRTLPLRDAPASSTTSTSGDAAPAERHRAGFVTLLRARDEAELSTNFAAAMPNLRLRVERFLRARDGRQHHVHPRVMRFLQSLSDRFNGRRIVVLSGYRPRARGAPLDRHAQGYAVDLRVEGAPLRAVWEFCQQVRGMGCGLYTGANYVHVDARNDAEAWTGGPRRRGQEVPVVDPDRYEDPAVVRDDARPDDAPTR
ncbi:MAG: LysM peptidoglycan-binding domain-containing protein [Polyangiales bacterium]